MKTRYNAGMKVPKAKTFVKTLRFRLAPCRREVSLLREYAGAARYVRNEYIRDMEYHRGEKEVRELTEAYMPGKYVPSPRPNFNAWWQGYKSRRLDANWLLKLNDHIVRERARRCAITEFDTAWKRYDKTGSVKKAGFPKMHGWSEECSFTLTDAVRIVGGKLHIPMARGAKTEWGARTVAVRLRPCRGAWTDVLRRDGKVLKIKEVVKENGELREAWWTVKSAVIKRELCGAPTAYCPPDPERAGKSIRRAGCNRDFRRADKWYASIQCEIARAEVLPRESCRREDVGVDAGVAITSALSTGDEFKLADYYNKRRVENLEKRRKRYQRVMARKRETAWKNHGFDARETGLSGGERKARQTAAIRSLKKERKAKAKELELRGVPLYGRRYEIIRRRHAKKSRVLTRMRENAAHQISSEITRRHGRIFVEDLTILSMTKSAKGDAESPGRNVAQKRGLNRSILEQGWGRINGMLEYKAEMRGGELLRVPPHGTSRECAECGYSDKKNRLSQADFVCRACGHKKNADINAAQNILARGQEIHKVSHGDKPLSGGGSSGGQPPGYVRGGFSSRPDGRPSGSEGGNRPCGENCIDVRPAKRKISISQGRATRKLPITQGVQFGRYALSLRNG